MKITLSRRDLLKGTAAVAIVASSPVAVNKAIDLINSQETAVYLVDREGNVLGATVNVVETLIGDNFSFEIDQFTIVRTGTAIDVKLNFRGKTYLVSLTNPLNTVLGDTAKLSLEGDSKGLALWRYYD